MSAGSRKPLSTSTMSAGATGRRQSTNPPRSSSPDARPVSPTKTLSTNGIARTPSARSPSGVTRPSRASVRRPGQLPSNLSNGNVINNEDIGGEEDARIENAVLIDNLKKSLRNAELVSEDYQRELDVLKKRMNEVMRDQARMEERVHDSSKRIEELETEKKDTSHQIRDMANIFESERMAMLRDREEQLTRESELKATIQRLKETIAGREMRVNADAERRMSRSGRTHSRSSSTDENGYFAPPLSTQRRGSSLHRSDSQSASRLVMQKDMVIESLRLELAEAQIKLLEMDTMKGDRVHDLERTLLETRMTNARLIEDNESFQLLLGEKTLNGDFTKNDFMQGPATINGTSGLGSLAEELESAEGESENYRRLEAETRALKDQNKALTLYIEKIISRVLMHENFENILDQKPDSYSETKASTGYTQKELPPPPPKDEAPQSSVLQRAMSVVGPRRQRPASQVIASAPPAPNEGPTPRARPQSQFFASAPAVPSKANEDQFTAPRIPLGRNPSLSGRTIGHRRTQSEKSDIATAPAPAAATVVNQMYRGPSPSGQPSPLSPGSTTPRTSYFTPTGIVGPPNHNHPPRPSSNPHRPPSRAERVSSSSNSAFSRDSNEVPSPPRNSAGNTTYTGAVMTQSKLRPLRLVQENREMEGQRRGSAGAEEEVARKKANRGSWLGWLGRGKDETGAGRSVSAGGLRE